MRRSRAGYRSVMQPNAHADAPVEVADFAGLDIHWDRRVLRPRAWTAEQSRWATEIARTAPPGPILELCCGAGQIGLLAARESGRELVQVDRDPVAAGYARRNAAAAGVRSDVRDAALEGALAPEERFPIVIADPPWLPTGRVAQYPDDPVTAVDGGADGVDMVLECLAVAMRHVAPLGHVVIQVGVNQQSELVAGTVSGHPGLAVLGVRDCRPGGILVHVGPEPTSGPEAIANDDNRGPR